MTRRRTLLLTAVIAVGLATLVGIPMTTPPGSTPAKAGSAQAAGRGGPADVATPTDAGRAQRTRPPYGAGELTVQITSLEPGIPTPGVTLRVRGILTASASAAVEDVRVALRVSPTPLTTRGEIDQVVAGEGPREGVPVAGASSDLVSKLEPGQSVRFDLSTPIDALQLGGAGAYVVGVEALGSSGSGRVRQDMDRTFLPWWPPGTRAQPVLLTMLWPLVGAPLRDALGNLLDEEPAVELSPAGRLATLLEAAAAAPGAVSLVADPQVVQAASEMADGYQVRTPDGLVAGTRSREVAAWLERLRTALAAPGVAATALLYGQPDVVAAERGGVLATLLRQRPVTDADTAAALGHPLPQRLVLVPGGAADEATLGALASADVGAVVLSEQAVAVSERTFFTPSGNLRLPTEQGEVDVLATDSAISGQLDEPLATEADRVAVRQRLLAQTLTVALELPETQRLLVAAPDPGWSPPAAGAAMVVGVVAATPWVQPTSVSAALAREVSSVDRRLAAYGPAEQALELPAAQVAAVRAQFRGLRQYAKVLTDPADLDRAAPTAPTRGMSGWLRTRPQQSTALVGVVTAQVREALASVRVVSSGTVTVAGSTGTIPVTVENMGRDEVTVGLELSSDPPQLFEAPPVAPFRIGPGRRTSVEVTAQVAAAGPIPVSVQLTTSSGDPFGTPGELTVRSSAYASAARVLVQLSLIALGVAVVVHGVRRARRRRRPAAGHPVDEPAPAPEVSHG